MIDLLNLSAIAVIGLTWAVLWFRIGKLRGQTQLLRELEGAHIMTGTTIHAVTGGEIKEVE